MRPSISFPRCIRCVFFSRGGDAFCHEHPRQSPIAAAQGRAPHPGSISSSTCNYTFLCMSFSLHALHVLRSQPMHLAVGKWIASERHQICRWPAAARPCRTVSDIALQNQSSPLIHLAALLLKSACCRAARAVLSRARWSACACWGALHVRCANMLQGLSTLSCVHAMVADLPPSAVCAISAPP